MSEKSRRRWKRFGKIMLVLVVIGVILHLPIPSKLTISPQTTRITGPINPDGTVNYVAHMDSGQSEGVTTESNAAVDLLRALGPGILGKRLQEQFPAKLGMPELPQEGVYFVPLDKWLAAHAASSLVPPREEFQAEQPPQSEIPFDRVWSAADCPPIAAWLDANSVPLEKLAAASAKPRLYLPVVSKDDPPQVITTLMPTMTRVRDAGKALCARATFKVGQGDIEGAWRDVLACHRLARLMSQPPNLIFQLVGAALEGCASATCQVIITSDRLTGEQAGRMLADLAALPPSGSVADCIDQGERFMFLDCIMMCYRGIPMTSSPGKIIQGRNSFDWDAMLIKANSWYDRMVAKMRMPYPKRVQADDEVMNELLAIKNRKGTGVRIIAYRLGGWPCRKALSNEIIDILGSMLVPALSRAQTMQDEAAMYVGVEQTALAIAIYKRQQGSFPAVLADLSPSLLKGVPRDSFTGKPLIYKPQGKGYLLYSVGPNMIDNGGVREEGNHELDDIAIRVGLPPAAATASKPADLER